MKEILDRGVASFDPEPDEAFARTLQRVRRRQSSRRLLAGVVALTILAGMVFGLWSAFRPGERSLSGSSVLGSPSSRLPSTPSPSSQCDYGPWSECSEEAVWVREVVKESGYALIRDTGSAFLVRGGATTFYMWADDTSDDDSSSLETLQEAVANGTYWLLGEVEAVTVYTDDVRLAWETQGLEIYIQMYSPTDSLPQGETLHTLVLSTVGIPYPVGSL
ncbi:MAG: hypothetical protein ACRDGU_08575 [Actinomycetota bacterium]